jgi:hypothetical protein
MAAMGGTLPKATYNALNKRRRILTAVLAKALHGII